MFAFFLFKKRSSLVLLPLPRAKNSQRMPEFIPIEPAVRTRLINTKIIEISKYQNEGKNSLQKLAGQHSVI